MARSRADWPDPELLKARISGSGELRLKVTPGSRTESLSLEQDRVIAKVRAKPKDGEANAAVEKLVARALGIAPSRCRLVRGGTSREKVLAVQLD